MFIIAGHYRRHPLITPKNHGTRPTANRLREAFFNICQPFIEGARFLDIFAGSGAMGLEALSRGAEFSVFIESHREALQCIEKNILSLQVEKQTKVLRGEAFSMLKGLEKQQQTFDIIYADPPYRTCVPHSSLFYSALLIEWVDAHALLRPEGLLFVEEDYRSLPQIHSLQTLTLLNSRRFGQAGLLQYQRS